MRGPGTCVRWIRCHCGKLHGAAYVGPMSECTCGRTLWLILFKPEHQVGGGA